MDSTCLKKAISPEAVGISSSEVINLIKELENIDYVYHGIMVIRNNIVAAECYRYPYNAEESHCMYSISKHVTATALAFAVSEGRLSLDDKLIDILPDKKPKKKDEQYKELTVRHLVTMTAGKVPLATLNKSKGDWIEHFTESKRQYKPGEEFQYVNECAFMLSVCLRKVLGIGINEYLKPRLWEPLGIETPYWETDRNGIEAGGWGIQLKLTDLAKLGICYANNGAYYGKQIIPAEWVKQAILNQTPTLKGGEPNTELGYGYSIWRYTQNRFHLEGMYGQETQIFEKQGLIFVIMGGDFFPQRMDDIFLKYSEKLLVEADSEAKPTQEYLDFVSNRKIEVYEPSALRPKIEKQINGRVYKLQQHPILKLIGFPLGVLSPATVFMSKNRAGNLDDFSFTFTEDGCFFRWKEEQESNTVFCSMKGGYHRDEIILAEIPFTAYSAAKWLDENTLELKIRPMQSIAERIFTIRFKGKRIKIDSKLSPSVTFLLKSASEGVGGFFKNAKLRELVIRLFEGLGKFFEPKTLGKQKNL